MLFTPIYYLKRQFIARIAKSVFQLDRKLEIDGNISQHIGCMGSSR